jgi:DNA-directed RNA polymerase specialized sigma24 family protein
MKTKNETINNKEERLLESMDIIKRLLILLVDKFGVEKSDIAKALGISQGRLSQILNPKKYKG